MVDDQVLGANRGKAIAAMFADAFGKARCIGFELEIGPVFIDKQRQVGDTEHAGDDRGVAFADAERILNERVQPRRRRRFDLQTDDFAAPPALQRRLVETHQILGFFLDFNIAVANDAKGAIADEIIAREQLPKESPDGVFQADEADRSPRQPDEAWQHRRQHQQRPQQFVIRLAAQFKDQRKTLVGDEGERMRGINRLRREHRKNLIEEVFFQPDPLARCKPLGGDDVEIGARQFTHQIAPDTLLRLHQFFGMDGDGGKLLCRCHALGRQRFDAGAHLTAQPGDPHHVEFIEVVPRNRQEAQPFEQRMGTVCRFLQHAIVERQPRNLAVEIAFGIRDGRVRRGTMCCSHAA